MRSSERAQLAAAKGIGRRGHLSTQIERVTFGGERASVVVRTGVSFPRERASGVGRRGHRRAITTCVSDVRKKATLDGNQRRRVLRHETHPIWLPTKEMHPTSMRL
jgi:hypothetical protein